MGLLNKQKWFTMFEISEFEVSETSYYGKAAVEGFFCLVVLVWFFFFFPPEMALHWCVPAPTLVLEKEIAIAVLAQEPACSIFTQKRGKMQFFHGGWWSSGRGTAWGQD